MTRSTAKYLALLALAIALFYWRTLLTDQYTIIIGTEGALGGATGTSGGIGVSEAV